ncbi:hypothetical protein, partial [Zooshikella harenae]
MPMKTETGDTTQHQLLKTLLNAKSTSGSIIRFELGGEHFEFTDSTISQSLVNVIREAAEALAKNPHAELHVQAS